MQIKSNNLIIYLNLTDLISDNEKLLLPTEEYYVLNHNEDIKIKITSEFFFYPHNLTSFEEPE